MPGRHLSASCCRWWGALPYYKEEKGESERKCDKPCSISSRNGCELNCCTDTCRNFAKSRATHIGFGVLDSPTAQNLQGPEKITLPAS